MQHGELLNSPMLELKMHTNNGRRLRLAFRRFLSVFVKLVREFTKSFVQSLQHLVGEVIHIWRVIRMAREKQQVCGMDKRLFLWYIGRTPYGSIL